MTDSSWFNASEFAAAFVGAAIGAGATYFGMRFARATERKKLTLEILVQKMWDHDYILCVQRLAAFRNFIETATIDEFLNNDGQSKSSEKAGTKQAKKGHAPATQDEHKLERSRVQSFSLHRPRDVFRSLLNFYELLAIGIRDQILDELMLKRYMRSEVLQNWRSCKRMVEGLRVRFNNERFYLEVERLADRWSRTRDD